MEEEGRERWRGVNDELYDQKLAALHGAWTNRSGYGGLEAGYQLYEESRSFNLS